MRASLQPGLSSETTVVVTKEMSPPHLPTVVLSTPDMIRQIEGACLQLAQQHLDDGELTVGTHVCAIIATRGHKQDAAVFNDTSSYSPGGALYLYQKL